MYSEAESWTFSNAVKFINASLAATRAQHFIDLGGWYGVLSRAITPPRGRHILIEAVIDTHREMRKHTPPRIESECTVVCRPEDYQPVIHLTPTNTLNTSWLGAKATADTVAAPVGPMCTPQQFVERWGSLLDGGGLKTNIEGQDIHVLLALIAAKIKPAFVLSEINVKDQSQWLREVWPQWQMTYNLQELNLASLLAERNAHIGVRDRYCCWWYAGKRMIYNPNKRQPVYSFDCAE